MATLRKSWSALTGQSAATSAAGSVAGSAASSVANSNSGLTALTEQKDSQEELEVYSLPGECERCEDEETAIKSRNKVIIFLSVVFLLLLTLDSVLLWLVIGKLGCDQTGNLKDSNATSATGETNEAHAGYSPWSAIECPWTQRRVATFLTFGSRESFEALSFDLFGVSWMVFQRRVSGNVDFNKGWLNYTVYGFGSINDSYWIDLENVHYLCNNPVQCELIINMRYEDKPLNPAVKKDPKGCYYARYSNFSVGHRYKNHPITVGGYSGTAGDSLTNARYPSTNVNKMWFHTYDSDYTSSKCVARHLSGWWHNNCTMANLNGCWASCPSGQMGIYWKTLGAEPLDFVEMSLRVKQ